MESVCGFALGEGGWSVNIGSGWGDCWTTDELDFLYGRKGNSLQGSLEFKDVQGHVQPIGMC